MKRANDDQDQDRDMISLAQSAGESATGKDDAGWQAMMTYGQGSGLNRQQWLMSTKAVHGGARVGLHGH
jgi:hypothetical protein